MRVTPKKSLGQNFLVNQGILEKIIRAARITSNDTVVEVGPGTGTLTQELAQRAGNVIAIEKDHRLIPELQERFGNRANIKIVEDDVLDFSPPRHKLTAKSYKLIGNIPYYITSHFLKTVLGSWPAPELIVLTVQKEVAERICARPPHMNLLALSVQFYAEPKIVGRVSRGSFRPIPKVDSAIIRLTPKVPAPDARTAQDLFVVIRAGFSEKRKQLAGTLSRKLHTNRPAIEQALQMVGTGATTRPENLSLEQWEALAESLKT